MSNIGLIIGHEYTTRVRKKSFIIITLLTPLLMILACAMPAWLMSREDKTQKQIVVIDKSGIYSDLFNDDDVYSYIYTGTDFESAKSSHTDVTGFLYISGDLTADNTTVTFYSDKQASSETVSHLKRILNSRAEQQKIEASGIPELKEIMRDIHQDINIKTVKMSENGEETITSAEFAEILGMMSALLIYIFIMMYGSMVMQGVVQEKSNRIMEVMVASTKPFDLMMGKIIAVALVGLTQFFIWVVMLLVAAVIIASIAGIHYSLGMSTEQLMQSVNTLQQQGMNTDIMNAILGFDYRRMLVLFVLYFMGGYLLYSSMFAACGSAVDNETDTQQFTAPLTILILFAMYAGIYATNHPDSQFTFWCSMIPFTSPVVMLVRLPFDVAWWELVLSLVILIASFIGSTWVAAKIYRVGILMYGKKPSWKEVWKWVKYK